MPQPALIYLVRHGQSEGNVDWDIHKKVPDWKLHLTEKGKVQADRAAAKLHRELCVAPVGYGYPIEGCPYIYCSPYYRAQETAAAIRKKFLNPAYREDPRLREQDWGNFKENHITRKIKRDRDRFGTFFYRIPYGESGADVYDRISTFMETLWRDFEKDHYPRAAIIVSHGLTIRLFLMRWFHWTVEEYESLANPHNGQVIQMVYGGHHYALVSKLRKKKQ